MTDGPGDQESAAVHGNEAEAGAGEADAAFGDGEFDAVRRIARQPAVALGEQLAVARERQPRQAAQAEGRDLQPLGGELDHIRNAVHKTTSGA